MTIQKKMLVSLYDSILLLPVVLFHIFSARGLLSVPLTDECTGACGVNKAPKVNEWRSLDGTRHLKARSPTLKL